MVIAQAITIDKSQGHTYDAVAFDLSQTCLKRAHYYVAWSRVRRLEDLYLFGRNSILQGRMVDNHYIEFMRESDRKKMAENIVANCEIHKEVIRLETKARDINRFPFTEESYSPNSRFGNDDLIICMHNVGAGALHRKLDSIKADYAMMNADVLIFVECGVKTEDRSIYQWSARTPNNPATYYSAYSLKDRCYNLLRLGSSRQQSAKVGCALYVHERFKIGTQVKFLGDNSVHKDGVYEHTEGNICELALFGISFTQSGKHLCVIYVYNHPGSSLHNLFKNLKEFIGTHPDYLTAPNSFTYVLGDMNYDLYKLKDLPQDQIIFSNH